MYLNLEQTLVLEELNFKPDYEVEEGNQTDAYWYEGKIFIVGGCQVPFTQESRFAKEEIYRKGVRLIPLEDLMEWLEYRTLYTTHTFPHETKLTIRAIEGQGYDHTVYAYSLQEAAYHMVVYLLKRFPFLATPKLGPVIKR